MEGEGALHVTLKDGALESVELNIYEPPRFFEAFLRGRAYTEPPDLTARVCGICPVAYQVSACNAIEDACGVQVDEDLIELRRLLYCGEWINSHALHIYLLHAPDFLGYSDIVGMARDHAEAVERGLTLKKAGNQLMEFVGGRAIHPVNVRLGGFYSVPTRLEFRPIAEQLRRALDNALATVEWVSGFEFPDLELEHEFLALTASGRYPIENGAIARSARPIVSGGRFHQPRRRIAGAVLHCPARDTRWRPPPDRAAGAVFAELVGAVADSRAGRRPRRACQPNAEIPSAASLSVRVEVVYAIEEALRIIDDYQRPSRPFVDVPARAGVGHGVSEAPRGLLYHRYRDRRGRAGFRGDHHPADFAEPGGDRSRLGPPRFRQSLSRRCRADHTVRESDSQLRSVHLMLGALLDADGAAGGDPGVDWWSGRRRPRQ